MINFDGLVTECLLLEYNCSLNNAYTDISTYGSASKFNDLKTFLNTTFKMGAWPVLDHLLVPIREASSRSTAESLISYANVYPLVDFIFYLIEQTGITPSNIKSASISNIDGHVTNFINECKKNNPGTNNDPFTGYVAVSGKGKEMERKVAKHLVDNPTASGLNALARVARGLSLGVPTMGGR